MQKNTMASAKKNKNNLKEKIEVAEDLAKTNGKIKKLFSKRKISKRKIALIAILLVIVGTVFWAVKSRQKDQPIEVKIEKGTVTEDLILTGEIAAEKHARLTFPTSGKLAWVGVSEGTWVYQGQALVSLDKTPLDAAYQQAKATLRKYEATLENIHDQVKNHDRDETFATKDTRTTAEVNKDYAYDALRTAEYNLNNATLLAPFAGFISFIAHPAPGINVTLTETQVEIVDPATMYFIVSADQSEVVNLQTDQKVEIVLDSFPEDILKGKISYISHTPKADESGTVYSVKVIFDKENVNSDKIRVGMTGDAKFILGRKDEVLYVPPRFINSDAKGKFVRLGKKNSKVYIQTGIEGEERVEIIGDIKEGDMVFD